MVIVNVNLYCHKVSNVLSTLVAREKPVFQALSKGLIVLLYTEVVWQGVPDHGALHSECSACSMSSVSYYTFLVFSPHVTTVCWSTLLLKAILSFCLSHLLSVPFGTRYQNIFYTIR